jgi:hypothetical protein
MGYPDLLQIKNDAKIESLRFNLKIREDPPVVKGGS